jgi:hypothetical protein
MKSRLALVTERQQVRDGMMKSERKAPPKWLIEQEAAIVEKMLIML